jgi:hypothetical protein
MDNSDDEFVTKVLSIVIAVVVVVGILMLLTSQPSQLPAVLPCY